MSRSPTSLPPDYFDALYARDDDPWRFETSDYERDKYAATLAALPARAHYAQALEVGCSIGVLTRLLAPRCGELLALDASARPLERARARCADLAHVRFARLVIPEEWPPGRFDLVILSEVLYYFDLHDLRRVAARVERALDSGGDIVCAHWIRDTDYPLSGDEAVKRFTELVRDFATPLQSSRTDDYRLDVFRRTGRPSTP